MLIQDSINTLLYDQPTTGTLKKMLLIGDTTLTHEVFAHIHRQYCQATLSLNSAQAFTKLLPSDISDYPPETQRLLAKLFLKTVPQTSTLPHYNTETLLPEVATAWLTTRKLLKSPQVYATSLCDEAISNSKPIPQRDSPVQQLTSLCAQGLISAEFTQNLLFQLLNSEQSHIVLTAIQALGGAWSTVLPCPETELLPLLKHDDLATDVLTTLSKGKTVDFLLEFASQNQRRYLKLHALSLIDAPLNGTQISQLLAIATTDTHFFAASVIKVLRNQHRRRHNFSKGHIETLFQYFISAPTIPSDHLLEIIRPSEKRWLRLLTTLHPHDASWERHIHFVGRMNTKRGNDFLVTCLSNPAFESLQSKITTTLAKNGVSEIETLGLILLKQGQIEPALTIIRYVGGTLSKQCLWAHIDGSTTIAGLSKTEALNNALAIEENIPEVLPLIPTDLLDSQQLPLLSTTTSPEISDTLLTLLTSENHATQLEAINQLALVGGAACLASLTGQLLVLDADKHTIIHTAIQQIGKRLYTSGSARPQLLLEAQSAQQAGEWLLTDCLLTLCEHTRLSDERLAGLLETVSTLQCQDAEQRVLPYLKHSSPHVQKQAITCLCHNDCVHLSDQLRHYLADDNIYTRRAALTGFATLGASWFDTEIAASLQHPNMNIKKTAAETLAVIGTQRSVPALLQCLASHDNPGLQERLINALKKITGKNYVPLVLAYLSQTGENTTPHGQRYCLLALNHELSARAVVIAYQDNAVWAEQLVKLINDGEYHLKYGQNASYLSIEAWRLGVSLPHKVPDSARHLTGTDIDGWLNGLLENTDVDQRDIAQWLTQNKALSTPQTMRLQRQLPTLIERLDSTHYGAASLYVLSQLVSSLSEGQKMLLATALRQQLHRATLPLEPLLQLLKQCDCILPHAVAKQALSTASPELQEWGLWALIKAKVLEQPLALSLLNDKYPHLHSPLIDYLLANQWHEATLQHCAQTGPVLLGTLQLAWSHSAVSEQTTINYLLKTLQSAPENSLESLLTWAATLQSDEIDKLLLSYVTASNNRYRSIAINALSLRPSAALRTPLSNCLNHKTADIRQAAASVLLAWPGDEHHPEIVQLYLQGSIHTIGRTCINQDLVTTLSNLVPGNDAKKKYIGLLCCAQISAHEQIEYLWPFLDEQDADVRATAESAIRGLPTRSVFDYLWPMLEAKQWGYLSLFQRPHIQSELIDYLETGSEDTQQALLDYFLSLPKPIHGHRLLDVLLAIQSPSLNDLIIELCGHLKAWEQPKTRAQLLAFMQHYLTNEGNQNKAIDALLHGIDALTTHDQLATIIQLLNERTQDRLLPVWTERCLAMPSAFNELPTKWQATVYAQLIEFTQDRDAEKARGALRLLVDNAHESYLDILDAALLHPKSRVRAYAHRLLRKVASKEHYLESSLVLLNDKELALRCGAIRTLSFSGYVPAVKGIAEQLFIKKRNVAKVASAGLLTMGKIALPSLQTIVSHARPDQRPLLLAIIAEIEKDL